MDTRVKRLARLKPLRFWRRGCRRQLCHMLWRSRIIGRQGRRPPCLTFGCIREHQRERPQNVIVFVARQPVQMCHQRVNLIAQRLARHGGSGGGGGIPCAAHDRLPQISKLRPRTGQLRRPFHNRVKCFVTLRDRRYGQSRHIKHVECSANFVSSS